MSEEHGELVAARLKSQLLVGSEARSPEEVVRHLLAVQAQDGRGARLAIRSRIAGLSVADVDDALTVQRLLLITWLNRGTLHLIASEDYWWLHPLTTLQLTTAIERRLRQERVTRAQAERGVDVIDAAVTDGPQTREQLRRRLDESGIPTVGQAFVHILASASVRGKVVQGPMIGKKHALASVSGWLGPRPAALDRIEALGMLTRRYLVGHTAAAAEDLAKWAGITLGDARRGIDAIGDEIADFRGSRVGLKAERTKVSGLPPPRLLGPFDPLLHGWKSRQPIVGAHGDVVTSNGIFRPVASRRWASGRDLGAARRRSHDRAV